MEQSKKEGHGVHLRRGYRALRCRCVPQWVPRPLRRFGKQALVIKLKLQLKLKLSLKLIYKLRLKLNLKLRLN